MKRLALFAACGALLLGACSADNKGADDVTTPATATTNTAAPEETSTTAAPTPTSATSVTIVSTTASEAATTSAKPATSTTTESTSAEYTPVASPIPPGHTEIVPGDNTWPDGTYYATVSEGGDPPPAEGSVVFEVVQLFIGDECLTHFGTDEDSCVNDFGVETEPTATVEVALTDQYISVVDAATQQSFRISGEELYGLVSGEQPAAGAPEGYFFFAFGFFVTFADGEITRLEQWWTP